MNAIRMTLVLPFLAMACLPVVSANAQNMVEFAGRTREYAKSKYRPLGHINISIYRTGPVTSGTSNSAGEFNIAVPAGVPFRVLFIGPDDYLPELQSLAGEAGTAHSVNVCLLTKDEAKAQGINPYKHIKAIIDQLEAQGVSEKDELINSLRDALRKVG